MSSEDSKDKLRFRFIVPIEKIVKISNQCLFGTFQASYWGHAYNNSARGKIPADSISLRPFHFLLYLSDSGKIYIASQYLGQFGGYTGLRNTIESNLSAPETIQAHSFRLDSAFYSAAKAKEVRISIAKKGSSITSGNIFGQEAVISFKKKSKDDGFEQEISKSLFPLFGKSKDKIKSAVAKLLKDNDLLDVSDDDIEDCTVIARLNGKNKTIHMLEDGIFASRFPIDVPLNSDGHPEFEPTKNKILEILKDEIISRNENV